MQAYTPITPLEPGVEMFQRGQLQPFFNARTEKPRPLSEATEIFDTDLNSDESEFEEDSETSPKYSFEYYDNRRRSQTTISTFEEVVTPLETGRYELPLRESKQIEGPKGPHLFRASQSSTEFQFDYALQMSPLFPKHPPPLRADTQTAFFVPESPADIRHIGSLAAAVANPDSDDVRSWTAQQVADWMYSLGFEDSIIERFEMHDITGAVLLDLQFEDLRELEIQSFGKRHKLWNEIEALRGNYGKLPSPTQTPFQDISRPCTQNSRPNGRDRSRSRARRNECHDNDNAFTPITPGGGRRRRGRKNRNKHDDIITPAESVSIVAIEQLLPKPHKCARGERCAKWRKQQRQLARLQEEHGVSLPRAMPISPEKGGHIFIAGDPGNAASAENLVENVYRPTSDAIPSVVASSDVLGPGQLPEFALQEDNLRCLDQRDPQDNVKQFLNLQGIEPPTMPLPVEEPPSPPYEMFPPMHHQPNPPLQPPQQTPGPHAGLKSLPKLAIPRSASANPHLAIPQSANLNSAFSPCRSATVSPGAQGANLYRFATPASEMDVPVTAIAQDLLDRDASQSVPPNMQYRDPVNRTLNSSRSDWRRPSFALPSLNENEVFSPSSDNSSSSTPTLHESQPDAALSSQTSLSTANDTDSLKKPYNAARNSTDSSKTNSSRRGFHYPGATHAGWMKKRKTRLLRHEWHDQHFRLAGTQLAMHPNELPSSTALDTIDVDDYAVACSSLASNKLAAKLKALKIAHEKHGKDGADKEGFMFQLVPAAKADDGHHRRKVVEHGKTHHFAVKTRDERIDWMRELMLAKALKAKGEGYEVNVNGANV